VHCVKKKSWQPCFAADLDEPAPNSLLHASPERPERKKTLLNGRDVTIASQKLNLNQFEMHFRWKSDNSLEKNDQLEGFY
jgi:hypothetical protein